MRINRFFGWTLGLCALACSVTATPLFADIPTTDKYDAVIKMAMHKDNGGQVLNRLTLAKSIAGESDTVKVLVKTDDNGKDAAAYAKKMGGSYDSRHGQIVSLTLPYNALSGLGKLSSVKRIEASMGLNNCNNIAAGEEYGTNLTTLLSENPNYTGRGIVVGVLDTGIDTTLPAFQDEEGNTRIDYFWDQSTDTEDRHPVVVTPEGESRTYEYGTEYTAADIDKQTESDPVCVDEGGHGTHVCGTIGGRDDVFPGMAPEVHYIVVKNDTGDDFWKGAGTGSCLDAYEYIVSRAHEMGLPLVINQSQGSCLGPHDGSTLFEQAIQADIEDPQRNMILCASSGNMNNDAIAAEVTIAPGETIEIPTDFLIASAEQYDSVMGCTLEYWSDNNAAIDMNFSYDATNGFERTVTYEETVDEEEDLTDRFSFNCVKEFASSLNGDDRTLLTIHSKTGKIFLLPVTIKLTNQDTKDTRVNLYFQRNSGSMFNDPNQICYGTVAIPGSTPGAITVGAYTSRPSFINKDKVIINLGDEAGVVSSFSSQGPMRKDTLYTGLNESKPDIVAPGEFIISQKASGYDDPNYLFRDGIHLGMMGTSMSCPVVTGTVALILQNMPNATAADIKRILFASALVDEATGEVPNSTYGHGKLQAKACTSSEIISPTPKLSEAAVSKTNKKDIVLTGSNFVPECDVFINGELWDKDLVEVVNSTTIILHDVYTKDSPLNVDGEVVVDTIRVVNRLAPAASNFSELTDLAKKDPTDDKLAHLDSGSGCFIATAAYGSYLEPEVMALRRFRDRDLITNAPGREFVKLYYTYSPPVANFIAAHPSARFATRVALTPLVYSVSHPTSALALALVLGLGVGGAVYRRRRQDVA